MLQGTNMRMQLTLRALIVALTCFGVAAPQLRAAGATANVTEHGIPIRTQVEDVVLQTGGGLQGALVDVNGKPVVGSPVAIGQSGKVVAEMLTDQEGRFSTSGLRSGTYQVASLAGVQSYRIWDASTAPKSAKQGVIHVLPEGTARGQGGSGVRAALTNPIVVVGAIVTAGVVAVAVASDDDDS